MAAIANTTDMMDLKGRLKATWMSGNYDLFSRFMESDAGHFYQRLGMQPGMRLLDVACGSGQVALIAARQGAVASGCDIATNWLDIARLRAASEGLDIAFQEGDAEALPYPDGSFDAVVSLFGAMFAPRPEMVAGELIRVCRPGGMIAMGNWTPVGFIGQMLRTIARHVAPSGMPSPLLWGDEETVRSRFMEGVARLTCVSRLYRFDYPFPPSAVVDFFRANYGPMSRAFAALDTDGRAKLRDDLVRLWSSHNKDGHGETKVDAEYLEVIAIRG